MMYMYLRYVGVFIVCNLLLSCKETSPTYHKILGETMGTYYAITYKGEAQNVETKSIDSLLESFNNSLSTYVENSTISQFNVSDEGLAIPEDDLYFAPVYAAAMMYYEATDGLYDPTVMPLVNYWGFGYTDKQDHYDAAKVDSIIQYVGMSALKWDSVGDLPYLRKPQKGMQLDFSSLAKGYAIDIVAAYLEINGIQDYLVDIGGEAKAKGKNDRGRAWTLAINKPIENAAITTAEIIVQLSGKALATSGNYRNVRTLQDGKKVSHTINPRTGYPERSNVLSATVVAEDCIDADALATCLMLVGLEEGKRLLQQFPEVDACIIYDMDGDEKLEKYYTPGFKRYIVNK